ncbi:unnamed protein product [Durusdinium trenchii]|uniref:Uncharacterized protein n=2 Tax=Durusdinium trenchii TaxID=1381693 RepID=A0ABP0KS51_9DINO
MKGAEGYPALVVQMIGPGSSALGTSRKSGTSSRPRSQAWRRKSWRPLRRSSRRTSRRPRRRSPKRTPRRRRVRPRETKKATEEKAQATAAAKEEVTSAEASLKAAKQALKTAEQEQKAGDAKVTVDEAKKGKLMSTMESVFLPCKEGALAESAITKGIADLQKLGKEYGFDTALLTSLPSALSKEPASRGDFDGVVVKQVEDELQKRLDTLTAELNEAEPARQARADKVANCKAAVEAGKMKQESLEKALKDATTAEKEAVVAAKAAVKALKAFGPEMKETKGALDEAKESLDDFTSGALKTFTELLEHTKPPPEPVEAEAAS